MASIIVSRSSKLVGCKKCSNYPPLELMELHRLPPPRNRNGKLANYPPPRIDGTSSTTPPSKSERKARQLPPPLELMELHRLTPPLEIGTETSPTTPPPRIDGTSTTTPPRNRNGNLANYPPPRIDGTSSTTPPSSKSEGKPRQLPPPPLELMELHRLPPLEIGTETSPTTPPLEFFGN